MGPKMKVKKGSRILRSVSEFIDVKLHMTAECLMKSLVREVELMGSEPW